VGADGAPCNHRRQCHQVERAQEKIMANDEEWVADVRRWCLSGTLSGAVNPRASEDCGDEIAVGYEAADPALQAHHWPDAPTTGR
jgi:hypothetical protein